jgi:hypothetical protein
VSADIHRPANTLSPPLTTPAATARADERREDMRGIPAVKLVDHVRDRLIDVTRYEPEAQHVYGDLDEIVTTAVEAVQEWLVGALADAKRDDLRGFEGAMRTLRSAGHDVARAVVVEAS